MCPNSIFFFFAPVVCWNFSSVNLDFHKGSPICGLLSRAVFSRGFWTVAERGWSWFTGHCQVHSQDRGLYAYYLMHRWVRLLQGPLVYVAGSHSSHKDTFVCGWVPNYFCCGGGQKPGTFYSTIIPSLLASFFMMLFAYKNVNFM